MRRLLLMIIMGLILSSCSSTSQSSHDSSSTKHELKTTDISVQLKKTDDLPHIVIPATPKPKTNAQVKNDSVSRTTATSKEPKQMGKQRLALNQSAKQNKSQTKYQSQSKQRIQMSQRSTNRLTIAQLHNKYPQLFKLRGTSRAGKRIALTFDDVPDRTITPVILDILKHENIKATFFLVGYRAERNPALVKRMVDEGHIIGNHTYNHPLLTRQDLPKFIRQLRQTENIIDELVGYKPRYFRPPFGEITEEQLQWAGRHGYLIVNWDVDSNDWRGIPASIMENNIMKEVSPGSIVLQHAGGAGKKGYLENTVKALPSLIKRLKAQQYDFVTIPELLNGSKEKG